uniref:Chitin-binding type-2 domain-containing protein n=1 Tax=Gongylonema pulchrum TaxID=637853 RepID=A0A183E5W8_9BILA
LLCTFKDECRSPFFQSYCISGYLFDEDVGRCVPAEECGIIGEAVAGSKSLEQGICDGVEDGVAKSRASVCVSRTQNPECVGHPALLTDAIRPADIGRTFCLDRPDGLYRHPEDCTRIFQCFGEEVFEHLPCTDGLVFNEVSGGCDYRSNVPECADNPVAKAKGKMNYLLLE